MAGVRLVFTSCVFIVFTYIQTSRAKVDIIELEDDQRDLIYLVSYGMFEGGYLDVDLSFTYKPDIEEKSLKEVEEKALKEVEQKTLKNFGFTIDRTHQSSAQTAQYGVENKDKSCVLGDDVPDSKTITLTFRENDRLHVQRGNEMTTVSVLPSILSSGLECFSSKVTGKENSNKTSNATLKISSDKESSAPKTSVRRKRASANEDQHQQNETNATVATNTVTTTKPELCYKLGLADDSKSLINISVMFRIRVDSKSDAGLFSVYFHNCHPSRSVREPIGIDALHANITGRNTNPVSYLSAGDIPEPYVFFTVSIVYMILAFIWIRVLRAASSGVYKTHYLMLTVLFCKSISAVFHGMNYYYIGLEGKEETVWAVIYYITYLMKTVMLFLTIILVGSGWTFIKHIFSEKEKKLFLIAIPLQVLLYISHVIMSETEVATKTYSTWLTLSYIVDVLCCAAILAPVYWSIKHLEEASRTNGKVAINLQKLKLFKTLYMTIIAYIYITRLIITVLSMTVPFSMSYLSDLFKEGTVLLFLIIWGYKFRPADDNPYFHIPPDSDDEQDDEVELIVTQNLKTTEAKKRQKITDEPENQTLLERNESSHELD